MDSSVADGSKVAVGNIRLSGRFASTAVESDQTLDLGFEGDGFSEYPFHELELELRARLAGV